jgi:hypothetical protein
MASKRKERKPSTITVEHSTSPGERAIQHPRRVSPSQVSGFGDVQVSRPHRFRNGKLVAVAGIPLKGEAVIADADAYAEGSLGEVVSDYIDENGAIGMDGWEAHAMSMFLSGIDEAADCF